MNKALLQVVTENIQTDRMIKGIMVAVVKNLQEGYRYCIRF